MIIIDQKDILIYNEIKYRRINMAYKSALEIIKETLPPEVASKFHEGSRKPFPEEQPVLDAARKAAEETMKKYNTKTLFPKFSKHK